VNIVDEELVSRADSGPLRRQDKPEAGVTVGETTGTDCCKPNVLSSKRRVLLFFLNVSAQHAAETAVLCACVARGILMAVSGVCEIEYLGFASENLDLDGYRPMGSGQARNAESGKNRGSFFRMSRLSTLVGKAFGEGRHRCGSLDREVSLRIADVCAVMDVAGIEFGRNCGAQ
jgi:hypothetical protein